MERRRAPGIQSCGPHLASSTIARSFPALICSVILLNLSLFLSGLFFLLIPERRGFCHRHRSSREYENSENSLDNLPRCSSK